MNILNSIKKLIPIDTTSVLEIEENFSNFKATLKLSKSIIAESNLIEAIINVIYSSLLGFSFVALAIKLNNIWPVVIFHVIWNFILMASSLIGVEVSKVSLLCNPLNIIMGVILWTIIIRDQRKKNKLKYSLNKVIKW